MEFPIYSNKLKMEKDNLSNNLPYYQFKEINNL
jgi:hypothetical protein